MPGSIPETKITQDIEALTSMMVAPGADRTKIGDVEQKITSMMKDTLYAGFNGELKQIQKALSHLKDFGVKEQNTQLQEIGKTMQSLFTKIKAKEVSSVEVARAPQSSQVIKILSMKELHDFIKGEIEKENLAPDEIVVGFDFDGTVNLPVVDPETKRKKACLRGGDETKEFFQFLKDQKIKSAIVTAASMGISSIQITLKQLGFTFEETAFYHSFHNEPKALPDKTYVPKKETFHIEGENFPIYQCYGIVAAESSYDKQIALDYLIESEGLNPKLIVFVDDGAINILTMYQHYSSKNTPIIAAYFPHDKSSTEPMHEEAVKQIENMTGTKL